MPVLKSIAADFRVSEAMAIAISAPGPDTHHYVRLHKSGYTTFEAIDIVAEFFGIERGDIGHAGLKDEDGVTDQFLAIAARLDESRIEEFNKVHGPQSTAESWMLIQDYGHAAHSLEPGDLDGNSFRIVARGLDAAQAERLGALRGRRTFFFVNYYDTQRFGVPHGPKQTHLLGRALLDKNYPRAFDLLRDSGSPEARACAGFTGTPEEFFAALDPRRIAFYLSSHASGEWNAKVRTLVREVSGDDAIEVDREGIPYVFCHKPETALEVLRRGAALRCRSYRWRDGEMTSGDSPRPLAVQTQIRISDVRPDDTVPGTWRCTMAFFLPSGCYGTSAVTQFFLLLPELS
ncbi:tRNA pseudouridine(13) synthase TruD [Nocardia sp. NPDC088792]|uniref:tRNA pseudouridine(13) synthase TruD n=1 Tax=Nocardia sp. NPDC088792 TaxID=3364332 RepID=UPI00380FEFD4